MKKLIEKINKIAKDYEELEYFYEPLIGEYEEHLDYFKIVEDKPGICLQDEDLFYKMFLTFISCKRDIYLGDQYDWLFDCQKPVSTLYDNDIFFSFADYILNNNRIDIVKDAILKINKNINLIIDKDVTYKEQVEADEKILKYLESIILKLKNIEIDDIDQEKLKYYANDLTKYFADIEMEDYEYKLLIGLLAIFEDYEALIKLIDIIFEDVDTVILKALNDINILINFAKSEQEDVDFHKLLETPTKIITDAKNRITYDSKNFRIAMIKNADILHKLAEKIEIDWNNKYIFLNSFKFDLLDKMKEFELKNEVLEYIYDHNQKIFKKLYQDNKNCNIAKMNSFEQIILKYQLNINFSLEFIKSNPNANLVEDIINQLQKNDWNFILEDSQLLEQIIINSSVDKLNIVNNIINQLDIPIDFLINHLSILMSDYELFMRNVVIINERKIKISNYEIFLMDSKTLLKRYKLVTDYDINLRKNSNNNDDFLFNTESFDYFDKYIELGYYSFIRNHLPYCKKSNENIYKRALLATSIDLDIIDKKDFSKDIITGKHFMVSDENLDDYICNNISSFADLDCFTLLDNSLNEEIDLNLDEIKILDDNYMKSNYEYDINGVIVSRIKVARYFNTLVKSFKDKSKEELIFNAIIYNSVYNFEQLDIIKNEIMGNKLVLNNI